MNISHFLYTIALKLTLGIA